MDTASGLSIEAVHPDVARVDPIPKTIDVELDESSLGRLPSVFAVSL